MSVGPLSRYQGLPVVEVRHSARGVTRSLPIRRDLPRPVPAGEARLHTFTSYDSPDLLALRFFGREELYWFLLDANDGRLPDSFTVGELVVVPSAEDATRLRRY